MDYPALYEICVEGHLTDRWSDWFEGLAVCHPQEGETIFRGNFVDQSELYGVLIKLHSLNLSLISVERILADRE